MNEVLWRVLIAALLGCVTIQLVSAADNSHHSAYAGQELRDVKSLSPDDIRELKRGGGWGLAKAAELNGLPGPAHVLELSEQLSLTSKQRQQMEALFAEMRREAMRLGNELIAAERELELFFRSFENDANDETVLKPLLSKIGATRTELRYTHLRAHLKTPAILSPEQIMLYNKLRGYASDRCTVVPKGHDPVMWRKHNGCN